MREKLIFQVKGAIRIAAIIFILGAFLQYAVNSIAALAQQTEVGILRLEVLGEDGKPLQQVLVTLLTQDGQEASSSLYTNQLGKSEFVGLAPKRYKLKLETEGYQTLIEENIDIKMGLMTKISLQMVKKISDTVIVQGESDNPIEHTSSPQAQLNQQILKTVPLQSRDFDQALPIVPGVIRPPDGKVSIKGARENQSALLINEADATDPATGNFALSIPLESINQVKIYTNPYLAEYGRFTGGLVKVETKHGGDKWKIEFDDLFPEPRFRGGHLFGFANFSPRLHLEGPILKNRLFFAQGLEYIIDKKPVRGLPSPNNEIRKTAVRSFTQLDWIVSLQQTLTFTLNVSPQRIDHVGLDFFNPQPVAPNLRSRDISGAVTDRLTFSGGSLLETTFQYKRIGAQVFGNGSNAMVFTPLGRKGNYFHNQDRATERFELLTTDTFPSIEAKGVHNIKFGIDLNYLVNEAGNENRTVSVDRLDGTTAQTISYFIAGGMRASNSQAAAFAQDQWLARTNLSFDYGIRFEAQRATEGISVMPRFAFSYSPVASGSTVLRGAFGLFYDKVPLNALSFVNAPRQIVTTFAPDGVTIIDGPRLFDNLLANRPNGEPNKGNEFASPRNETYSFEFDQRINKKTLFKIAYLESRTQHDLYVSPTSDNGRSAITLFNNGHSLYRSLEATATIKFSEDRDLTVSYIRSRALGELNDFVSYFGDFPDPILRPNQFSNLPSDAPNRMLVRGNSGKLPFQFSIVPLLDIHTGFPFSVRNAKQDFVGLRNSDATRFPRFASLDLSIIKDVHFRKKYTAQFIVNLFNVTNHFNPRNVKANIDDPEFKTFFANYRRFYHLDFAFTW